MSEDRFSWYKFLFSFKGRINRKQYWLNYALPILLPALIVSTFVDIRMGYDDLNGPGNLLFLLLILWPSAAIQTKRWHDRNKSGWWFLICLIPLIGPFWVLIEVGFLPGTAGPNRYDDI